jgi:predicted RNA binding protein YcfA (HicA-like mRNA interferase family)
MDGKHLIKQARKAGLEVKHGKGDHVKIKHPTGRGYMICPARKIGKGLASQVVKWLLSAGVPLAIFLLFLFYYC